MAPTNQWKKGRIKNIDSIEHKVPLNKTSSNECIAILCMEFIAEHWKLHAKNIVNFIWIRKYTLEQVNLQQA